MLEQAASLLNNVNVGHAADIAQQQLGGGNAANGVDKNMLQDVMSNVLGNNPSTAADQNDVSFAKMAFDKIYGQGQKSSSPQDLGAASALKAFQMFAGGGNTSGGGGASEKLAGLAMSEGMKLFTSNNAGAGKNDILKSAVLWVMKFFMTHQQGNSNPAFNTLMGLVGGGSNTANMTNPTSNAGQTSSLGSKILGKFM
ncbi:hypothetical protein BJV82DRAFT_662841 [Fennellomyces sp. T-0311]|nr:hypothetical protein BJV82DRAFT_662841 [Fennellomyces sp. T-0311]